MTLATMTSIVSLLLFLPLLALLTPATAYPIAYPYPLPHPHPHPYPRAHPYPYPRAYPDPYPELEAVVGAMETRSNSLGSDKNGEDYPVQFPKENGFAADFPVETPSQGHAFGGDAFARGFAERNFAGFGAGAPADLMPSGGSHMPRGVTFDDRPFPGDAYASIDRGGARVPLGPGERIVMDDPRAVDDTEDIPLAGPAEAARLLAARNPGLY